MRRAQPKGVLPNQDFESFFARVAAAVAASWETRSNGHAGGDGGGSGFRIICWASFRTCVIYWREPRSNQSVVGCFGQHAHKDALQVKAMLAYGRRSAGNQINNNVACYLRPTGDVAGMADPFEDFMDEEVVDTEGNPIGTLACYWEHDEGKPVLLGIDVGGQGHHTHLMPAKDARPNAKHAYIVVNYTKEKVSQAPCLDCGCELDGPFEKKVFAYYGEEAFDYNAKETAAAQRELRRRFRAQASPLPVTDPVTDPVANPAAPPAIPVGPI